MVLRRRLEKGKPGKEVETNGFWNQRKALGGIGKGSQPKSAHVCWIYIPFKTKPIL